MTDKRFDTTPRATRKHRVRAHLRRLPSGRVVMVSEHLRSDPKFDNALSQGRFGDAIEMIREEMSNASPEERGELSNLMDSLMEDARASFAEVVKTDMTKSVNEWVKDELGIYPNVRCEVDNNGDILVHVPHSIMARYSSIDTLGIMEVAMSWFVDEGSFFDIDYDRSRRLSDGVQDVIVYTRVPNEDRHYDMYAGATKKRR